MDKKGQQYWRAFLVYIFILVFAIAIINKVITIQLKEGPYLREMADDFSLKYDSVGAVRGNIYTLEGKLLATSIPVYDIRIDFASETFKEQNKGKTFEKDLDSLCRDLNILFRNSKNYKKYIKKSIQLKNHYFLLERDISVLQLNKIKRFPIFRKGIYKGGFIVEEKSKRVYPFNLLAKRSIGKAHLNCVDCNNVGLEGAYNKLLQGSTGKRLMQRVAKNNWKPVNDNNEIEPKNGMDVITTLDINLQDVAENALQKQLKKSSADHGCVVLMEVETGYIKAIANLKRDRIDSNYYESYNFAIGESSEPGSTFKLASIVVALDDGVVELDDILNTGRTNYSGEEMKDSHYEGTNIKMPLKKAFAISSNVAISQLIHNKYSKNPQKFIDGLYRLGLNNSLDIDIKGEQSPYIKNTKDKFWSALSLPWISIGYEINITPLQLLTFYNAIANNGRLMKPLFVKEIRTTRKILEKYEPYVINESICSQETIKKVKELLENGTAKNIKNDVYKIAGKTGTAQIANTNQGYKSGLRTTYRASFVGYFPADNPKYSCVVVINNPATIFYGSAVAAPVFKEIADRVYATRLDIHDPAKEENQQILAIPKYKKSTFEDIKAINKIILNKPELTKKIFRESGINENIIISNLTKDVVPDLIGLSIKDAIYFLENHGLKVVAIGKGAVVRQSLNPGSKFTKGSSIILYLG